MGASGVGLFHDDVAADVRSRYLDLLASGSSDTDAHRIMLQEWKDSLEDSDDGAVFWLALAATQWEYGRLHSEAKSQALKIIDQGTGLDRWAESGLAKKRQMVLSRLRNKLVSPQPAKRKPRPRRNSEPPSHSTTLPDGTANATVWSVQGNSGQHRSQVYITMKVNGGEGGGSVFVAQCPLECVKLKWLNDSTLQIFYPNEVIINQQRPSSFYRGRTIVIKYRRE